MLHKNSNTIFNASAFVKNQKGMSLLEIMIVLVIVGGLMGVLLPQITGRLNKSKVSDTKIRIGTVMNAVNMYYTDCGKFPEALSNLYTPDPNCSNWNEPYIKKDLTLDAWKKEFILKVEGSNFTVRSLGADGREGGAGFDKDLSSDDLGN